MLSVQERIRLDMWYQDGVGIYEGSVLIRSERTGCSRRNQALGIDGQMQPPIETY